MSVLVILLLISLSQSCVLFSLPLVFFPILFLLESFILSSFIVCKNFSTLSNFIAHSVWVQFTLVCCLWGPVLSRVRIDELISFQNLQISCYLLIVPYVRLSLGGTMLFPCSHSSFPPLPVPVALILSCITGSVWVLEPSIIVCFPECKHSASQVIVLSVFKLGMSYLQIC